jgi:hypothetical protein
MSYASFAAIELTKRGHTWIHGTGGFNSVEVWIRAVSQQAALSIDVVCFGDVLKHLDDTCDRGYTGG